jgi:5,10-methylenetetrahydromethanopterin reductase
VRCEGEVQVGFFFWPFTPDLVRQMAENVERYGYDMIGIADTPGNAMDPWVAGTIAAQATSRADVALCVTNLATRLPAVSAAAIASLDLIAPGRAILGIGAGHSGTRNLGVRRSTVDELEAGALSIMALLRGKAVDDAHLPWVRRSSRVFLAASGPKALAVAGRAADGVFINFGIARENIAQSEADVAAAATSAGRDPAAIATWQVAALDCSRDGDAARRRIGAILAFMAAGYVLGSGDLGRRGVPAPLHGAIRELARRYSTRPGAADAELVEELGLFNYLAARFAVYGTPTECIAQLQRAKTAGLQRVMLTVSLASDPVEAIALFGGEVLPTLR